MGAQIMKDLIRKALHENVYTCLPKPIDMPQLLRLLKKVSGGTKNDIIGKGAT